MGLKKLCLSDKANLEFSEPTLSWCPSLVSSKVGSPRDPAAINWFSSTNKGGKYLLPAAKCTPKENNKIKEFPTRKRVKSYNNIHINPKIKADED